jgi:competence protein ComEC
MVVLLLPLVAAILIFDHFRPFVPEAEEARTYGFVIESAPKSTAKCERFETKVIGVRGLEVRGLEVYLYLLRDSTRALPSWGDTVVAKTQIEWSRRTGRAFAARYTILPAKGLPIPLQVRLYRRLADAGLSGDELATTGALTLGYKDDIDPEVRRHFQASGAAHVLAVSGLHTGILYGLVLWLLTFGGRFKPLYENRFGRCAISGVVIAVMWGYAWLTGMTPSVVRAVTMVTIFEVGRMVYRQAFSLNTIAAAAVLILAVRPTDLWSVSFQLSFAATTAIVCLTPTLPLKEGRWPQILKYIVGILVVSLAAQIGTLPITMYYFGQISCYFLLTNLIVLPIATVLVPCGLATIVLGGSWLGTMMGKITYGLAWAMNHSTGWIESLPGSTVSVHIGFGMVVVYFLFFILFITFLIKNR